MSTGLQITFDPHESSPTATDVQYLGGADAVQDLVEGARALLHRAAAFVNVEDGYEFEADAARLSYQLITGLSDMLATPERVDESFSATYPGYLLAHVTRLLRKHPLPPWESAAQPR